MAQSVQHENQKYTYADYLTWPEDERWELIDGEPYCMSPAPTPRHQIILVSLVLQVGNFLKGKPCQLFPAPFDVRFVERDLSDQETLTVVQPDISVICDPQKIDERGCKGAPDFIVEIVSPSSVQRDLIKKTALYEKYGVREYWVIHPVDQILTVYVQDEATQKFGAAHLQVTQGRRAVATLPGLEINLDEVMGASAQNDGTQGAVS
ncbi:TPA: Uma2 family endonuclease [Candidatus Sumerlaeota bacterium]|jgi:Uma2 family endonuclease|nr:Uma2 family endonuclease [Candidatus Sumerlaeota bacterium]